ncbi:hypothetical protein M3P05_12130 [Sansalvadorimonas sp. 2012CJ34-2]|uniref:Uncharacterized protein n=1 Tax=Parendozoicomonas callyspongiae TaxID=2942213 RepID=A0ABT0PH36_9GAMM|nr:hypothetical protein [Sansalvadorimonas sp. 2012CJ34-2]MCL6270674.1 hypothetical protein [Sansalvadorimonas sp. 2012CJ34-2]
MSGGVQGPQGPTDVGMLRKVYEGVKSVVTGKAFTRSVSQEESGEQHFGVSDDVLRQFEVTQKRTDQLWRNTPEHQEAAGKMVNIQKFGSVVDEINSGGVELKRSGASLEELDKGSSDKAYSSALMAEFVYNDPRFEAVEKEVNMLEDVCRYVEATNKDIKKLRDEMERLKAQGQSGSARRAELAARYSELLEEMEELPQVQKLEENRAELGMKMRTVIVDLLQEAVNNETAVMRAQNDVIGKQQDAIRALGHQIDLDHDGQGFEGSVKDLKVIHRQMMKKHKVMTAQAKNASSPKHVELLLKMLNEARSEFVTSSQPHDHAVDSFKDNLQSQLQAAVAKRNTPEAQERIQKQLDALEGRTNWSVNAERLGYLERELGELSVKFSTMRETMRSSFKDFVKHVKGRKLIAAKTALMLGLASWFSQRVLKKRVVQCTDKVVSVRKNLQMSSGMVTIGEDGTVSVPEELRPLYKTGLRPRPVFTREGLDKDAGMSVFSWDLADQSLQQVRKKREMHTELLKNDKVIDAGFREVCDDMAKLVEEAKAIVVQTPRVVAAKEMAEEIGADELLEELNGTLAEYKKVSDEKRMQEYREERNERALQRGSAQLKEALEKQTSELNKGRKSRAQRVAELAEQRKAQDQALGGTTEPVSEEKLGYDDNFSSTETMSNPLPETDSFSTAGFESNPQSLADDDFERVMNRKYNPFSLEEDDSNPQSLADSDFDKVMNKKD